MALTKVTGDFIKDGVLTQAHLHTSHGITTAHIGEGSNLYFTNARVASYLSSNNYVSGTGTNNRLAIWNGTGVIDSDSDFYVDGDTIFTTNFQASGNISITGTTFLDGDVTIGDTNSAFIGMARAGANYLAATNSSGQLVFRTGGSTAALTLDASQNATFAGDITVSGGDITLSGTGRIQGIDTVSANTDAANKLYVDDAVAGIVDSAPSTLDTLNELAAALGDDPNFATTTANSIGGKMPIAGGTFTGAVVGTSFSAAGGFLNGSNGGIRIHSSGTKFFNITAANAARDGVMDIGASDARFKDLYLSGNITAGGNVTASSGTGHFSVVNASAYQLNGTYIMDSSRNLVNIANITATGDLTADQVITTNNGNGQNYRIGDDAWIGDINVANTFRISGNQNSANGYITFGNSSNDALGRAGTGALTWAGNTIWHAGNDGPGSGLNADLLDGIGGDGYLRSNANDTATGNLTLSSANNHYQGHFYYDPYNAGGAHYPHFLDGSDGGGVDVNWRLYTGGASYLTHVWDTTKARFVTRIESSVDMRTPIFYDIDNTGYYVNPAAGSKLVYLGLATDPNTSGSYRLNMGGAIDMNNNSIDYVSQLHFYDDVRFYDDGNDNYLNFKYGDANNGGIKFLKGDGALKGYIYASDSGFGLLDSDEHWTIRSPIGGSGLEFRSNNNVEFTVNDDHTLSHGSSRAPIFYDSNNTSYYLDPTSSTSLRTVGSWRANSHTWDGEFAGKMQYHSNYWYIQTTNGVYIRNASGANNVTLAANGVCTAANDWRAPQFYDSADTNYYANLNGKSHIRKIVGVRTNLATSEGWGETNAWNTGNQTGYFGGDFTINGSSNENNIGWEDGPSGTRPTNKKELVWKITTNSSDSGADGGWNKTITGIDYNKSHISILYVKRVAEGNGNFYHGTTTCLNLNGTTNGNPYFQSGASQSLPLGVWCVSIGFLRANNDTASTAATSWSGVYRLDTGERILGATDYRLAQSTTSQHRCFLYYSTNTATELWFANPGFYEINGNEPKLSEILMRPEDRTDSLRADVDMRAPVFYDRDNTSFYVDPSNAGTNTSINTAGVIRGNYYVGTNYAADGYTVYKGYDNWNHFISIRGHCRPGQSKTQAAILGGHQTSFVEYAESNSSTGWFFIGSGQTNYIEVAKITRAFSSFTASVRAPLFYDTNNTGYYVDPASTSNLNAVTVAGSLTVGGDTVVNGNLYGRSVNQAYSNVYRMGGYYFTWDSDSHGTNTHHSIRSTYGDAYQDSITLNSYNHIRFNIDSNNNNGESLFQVGDGTTGTGNVIMTLTNAAKMTVGRSGLSPQLTLEYDDHANGVRWDTVIDIGKIQERRSGDNQYPTYVTNNGYGISFQSNSDGVIYGMEEWTTGNYRPIIAWGDDSSDTPMRWLYNNGEIMTLSYNGHLQANGSSRAPIFYDSNNTAYYINAASTSVINGLTMAGALQTAGSHTVGSSGTSNIYMGGVSGNHFRFHIHNGATYFDMNSGTINWRQGSSTRYYFYPSTANMTINGTLTQYSDIRYKENIVEIPNAIDKVKSIRGVYYNRTDFNTEPTKIGVIAQEVEVLMPELILQAEDTDMKSVSYNELTAVLVQAIKEQQTIIDDLKSRLETLENQ